MARSIAILNTRTTMNLANPVEAEYYDAELVAYVVSGLSSQPRIVTSWGSTGWKVGEVHEFHADQSRRHLGFGKIEAVVPFVLANSDLREGWFDHRNLTHWVVK